MPEDLSPGVYINEVSSGTRPIEGVGTAMAAFVGFAPAGPANTPTLITNWSQYVDTFGAVEENGRRDEGYVCHTDVETDALLFEEADDSVCGGEPKGAATRQEQGVRWTDRPHRSQAVGLPRPWR